MSFDLNDVDKVAHLARLQLSEEERAPYADTLSDILSFVEQMNALDVSGIEPMAHPMDATQRLRVDEVTETDRREAFQAVAPAVEDGLYLVPKVIE